MHDADAIRRVAELFAPSSRETILLENFDNHLTELSLIRRGLANTTILLDLGGVSA